MSFARPRTIAVVLAAAIVAAVAVTVALGAASTSSTGQVNVRQTALGTIVVDSKGRTLYLYAPDKHGKSSCYGECAEYWPPLIKTNGKLAGSGVKASFVTTTKRTNGKIQLVYDGHPLYRFAQDAKAGQTNGQGLNAAGGLWWVLSPSGKPIEKKQSTPPATTTTASGGGGGYGSGG